MTRIFIAVFAVCLFSTSALVAQPLIGDGMEFPYEALVLRDGAAVRSGPGQVHYATDKLEPGTAIEVYRHDPGGWCAIRPPTGSFSLVPESSIEIVEENVGRVAAGSAQAWVGTRLGVVESPLWQIKLKENELVEILGEVSWPNPEGHSTIWYQVAPPAGEFRWIQISDIQLPDQSTRLPSSTPPQSMAQMAQRNSLLDSPSPEFNMNELQKMVSGANSMRESPATVPVPQLQTTLATSVVPSSVDGFAQDPHVQQAMMQTDTIPDTSAKSINSGWRPARRKFNQDSAIGKHVSNQPPNQFTAPAIPSLNSSPSSAQWAGSVPGMNPTTQPPTRMASANMEYNPAIHTPGTGVLRLPPNTGYVGGMGAGGVGAANPNPVFSTSVQLNQLEMALTNEMLKHPASWSLDDLMLQTEGVIVAATDPAVTQHGNWLLEKIRRCRNIRAQYRTAYNDNPMANAGPGSPLKGPVGTGIDPEVEFGTTFDAFGWLNELVRDNGTSPSTFVLQDENGTITHHVAGAPGLNLRRYLKSKVGIVGQRGYNQALNLDHVTAERVVELHVRR